MQSPDTKTERVQLTLPRSLVTQCRQIAEQSGLTLSKVLEHFARSGVQQGLTLTFSANLLEASSLNEAASLTTQQKRTSQHGSKPTTSQTPSPGEAHRAADEALLAEIFEPEPARPVKPLGEMTDGELDALDERDTARGALAAS